MTKGKIIEELNNSRFFISDITENVLLRTDLGVQSLAKYKDSHRDIITKLDLILKNSNDITSNVLKEINSFYNNYVVFIKFLMTLDDVQFINSRKSIIDQLDSIFEDMKGLWQQIAGVIINRNLIDLEKENERLKKESDVLFNQIKEDQENLHSELKNTISLKNSLEQELNDYKERYSDINTNVELETQINVFETQAKKNLKDSNKWLWGVILSGAVLILILISIYCNLTMPADLVKSYTDYNTICETCGEHVLWVDMIRYIFFKLLIISTNIYILSFCVKNYNACMHNKTNNDHRHNSFRAALHFYNTTTSEKREEILIKVADAIFTYQKSGYYGKDSEPSNPSIIQSVIEKVSGKAE